MEIQLLPNSESFVEPSPLKLILSHVKHDMPKKVHAPVFAGLGTSTWPFDLASRYQMIWQADLGQAYCFKINQECL